MADEEIGLAKVVDLAESRQVRRARAREALRNANSIDVVRAQAQRLGTMLAAVVRPLGRLRIAKEDLIMSDAEGSRLDIKVQENGDLMVSYLKSTDGA